MKHLTCISCAGAIFLAVTAHATISFDIQAEKLRTSGGADAATTTLVMLVADTNADGFGAIQTGASLTAGSFLNAGGDDRILYKTNIASTTNTVGEFADFQSLALSGGWGQNDPLALVWFPTLTTGTPSTSSGNTYGLFSGPANDGSNNWITPADGTSNYKLYFFTTAATDLPASPPGTNAASLGNASLVVGVPEPSRLMLLGLGVIGLFIRRRR